MMLGNVVLSLLYLLLQSADLLIERRLFKFDLTVKKKKMCQFKMSLIMGNTGSNCDLKEHNYSIMLKLLNYSN